MAILVDYFKVFINDFLRGFFDAEGYVSYAVNYSRKIIGSVVVGAANTRLDYLLALKSSMVDFKIEGSIRKTNERGDLMTVRGRTWTRRHDVFHFVIQKWESVARFQRLVGFHNKMKKKKLSDLIGLRKLTPRGRFVWFTEHYEKRGRKWFRIGK